MPIDYLEHHAVLQGVVTVEEADPLLAWLLANPKGKVDLQAVSHLHTAVLQVLLGGKPLVMHAFRDPFLAAWVAPLMSAGTE